MYSRSSIIKGIKNPGLACRELNSLFHRAMRFGSSVEVNEDGIDILSADWDKLIILDACRYDIFEELGVTLPGTLTKVESKASATNAFLRANFSDMKLHDTVYVTANPQLYRIENGIYDIEPINVEFHAQIDIWQDGWDEHHRTVMPGIVTEAARKAAERYPNKRLIVHYLQPHAPYVGPTGVAELPTEYLNFWASFRDGKFEVSLETAIKAYRENLELVLPHVSTLLSEFGGKTVVTADHGELLGERDSPIPVRRFGHLSSRNFPALIEVPWLVNERPPRPEIVAEPPERDHVDEEIDAETVKQRLRDLGYAE